MTDVACFCGCIYSFAGDLGICPRCGEHTTLNHVATEEERQMRHELDDVLREREALVVPDSLHQRS